MMPASITMALPGALSPCVKVTLPAEPERIGVCVEAVTVIAVWAAALIFVPSLTLKLTVRVAVLGTTAVEVNVIAWSAFCHWASVAVLPLEVNVNTPLT